MTATTVPTTFSTDTENDPSTSRTTPVWRTGARAGLAAAVATSAVAAAALAADVPLEIADEQIPVLAFAQLTLMCTALGVVLAKAMVRWAARPQHSFSVAALVLTGLSFVPDVTADATTASKLVLIATHVVAAAIVIPALAARLPERRAARS